ncbi:MAG: hypothetical protein E7645_06780 [Ruminococcaceae bacterium]|nr:hypothetical protein [Oscillospiraceae bacterium]
MQIYTQEALATQLQKIFAGHRPRVIYDVTDKGENIMEFLIENPHNPRFSIVFQAQGRHQQVDVCTLRFGQAEIKGMMEPEMVPSAITTILNDELVAIVQYKNDEAYDNRRSIPNLEWLYQLTDDEDDDSTALEKMKQKLSAPPSFFDKLRGNMIGIFEIFSWSSSEIIKR